MLRNRESSERIPHKFSILDFGALGDQTTDNTQSIQQAIIACYESGGGQVIVPPGVYLTGPLQLMSCVDLHLRPGAVLYASPNLEDYMPEDIKLSMESDRSGLITARDAHSVSITGRGVIDGNGIRFMDTSQNKQGNDYDKKYTRQNELFMDERYGTQDGPLAHGDRPGNLIRFQNCKNVFISGVTIQNSPTWTVQINHCDIVNIIGVMIHSHGSDRRIGNDDGIDLVASNRVHISNCDIQTGDDCIALFGSKMVTVNNCTLSSRSSGIRVGFNDGDTEDCVFSNLVIDSNRGININVRGEGSVKNILFSDLIIHTRLVTGHWWGKGEPIHISSMPWNMNAKQLGRIDNIRFRNIAATGEAGILIHGCKESHIQNIQIDQMQLRICKGELQESYGGNFDLRSTNDMATALFAHDIPGLYACFFEGLTLRGLEIIWDLDLPPFYSPDIVFEDFREVRVNDIRVISDIPQCAPMIRLHRGEGFQCSGELPWVIVN